MDREITAIAAHLRQARRILFITGAGISADSGLPTVEINPARTELSQAVDYRLETRIWEAAGLDGESG